MQERLQEYNFLLVVFYDLGLVPMIPTSCAPCASFSEDSRKHEQKGVAIWRRANQTVYLFSDFENSERLVTHLTF